MGERNESTCTKETPIITRAEIEAAEKAEREFLANYTHYCVQNAAKCTANETCYLDGRHHTNHSDTWVSQVTDKGTACVCQFPYGRAQPDGTGICVKCWNGSYVQKTDPN